MARSVKRDTTSLLDDSFSLPAERFSSAAASGSSLKRGFLLGKETSVSSPTRRSLAAAGIVEDKIEVEEELPALFLFNSMLQEGLVKPTDDMLKSVLENKSVRDGFRDPEIMAAVREISKDRGALRKYQNNPRVMSFYSQLQKLMGTSRIMESFKNQRSNE